MIVKELIRMLKRMPEDTEVVDPVVPHLCTGMIRNRVVLIKENTKSLEHDAWDYVKNTCKPIARK